MNLIQQITNDANQTQTIVLPDGTSFDFTLYYVDLQIGWFITNLTYGTFTLSGFRVSRSPNMLNQYRNQIPFGLGCVMTQDREPTQQLDFSTGVGQLYLLSAAEVAQFSSFLTTGVLPAGVLA